MQDYFDNIARQMQEDAENHHRTIKMWGDDEAQDADPARLAAFRAAWARSAAIKDNEKLRKAERRALIAKEKTDASAERRREKDRLRKAAQRERERERAKAIPKEPAVAPASPTISATEAQRRIVAWIKAAPTAPAQRRVKNDRERLKLYARAAALLSADPTISLSALATALGISRAAAQNIRDFVRRNAKIFAPKKAMGKTALPEIIKYDDITDIEAMLAMAEEEDVESDTA